MTPTQECVATTVACVVTMAASARLCHLALGNDTPKRVLTQRKRYFALTLALAACSIVAIPGGVTIWSHWDQPDTVSLTLGLIRILCVVFTLMGALVVMVAFMALYGSPVDRAYKKDGSYRLVDDVRRARAQWWREAVDQARAMLRRS